MLNEWTYSICEVCKKNAHKEHKMVKRNIPSTEDNSKMEEFWVCTKCGYTRKL